MDFLVRQWWIRRTRKSIVRLKQQAVDEFRYDDFDRVSLDGKPADGFRVVFDFAPSGPASGWLHCESS
ncbi:hypothetical protein Rcae01_03303 [Novipirellula caenicola]|uniref:Uncharacterized protein n=1 Tax=Novipirellula caenicola TaxID=1536901 RepID=A0ABP9VU62_9BACT